MKTLQESINLLNENKKYLIAVSGGIDSMVLLHLFQQSTLTFSIVHCNFKLRNEDSFKDEQFIRDYCKKYNIQLFVKVFDTLKLKKNRESVEMIARNLRYGYFKELIDFHQFDYLITAHHLNDHIETFFINLLRGSGLKGLSGIQKQRDYILRPLLEFSRKEILDYAQQNNIAWQEDYTNQTTDYLRNKIRHLVIPQLEQINPDFLQQAEKSISIINESQKFIQKQVLQLKKEITLKEENKVSIFNFEKLKNSDPLLIYHFLSYYGFTNQNDCNNIINSKIGSSFISKTHKLWINRNELLIESIENYLFIEENINIVINALPFEIKKPIHLALSSSKNKIDADESIDFDTISFPLILRNWKEGDYFYPINGNGRKKISKYLKDAKVSNYQKKEILVLCDCLGKIVYLIGFRLDDRFKTTEKTTTFLNLTLGS